MFKLMSMMMIRLNAHKSLSGPLPVYHKMSQLIRDLVLSHVSHTCALSCLKLFFKVTKYAIMNILRILFFSS